MSNARRTSYRATIIVIALFNVLHLTGILGLPSPIPAALFALNAVLFIRLYDVKMTPKADS